jgi:hypothetical protein
MRQTDTFHPAFRLRAVSEQRFRCLLLKRPTYLKRPDPGQDEVDLHRFDALVDAKRKNAKLGLWQVSKCLLGCLAENSSLDLFNNRRTCKNTSCSEWSAINDDANSVMGASRAIWYP